MSDLWKKLNYKEHPEVVVLDAPASFEPQLERLVDAKIIRSAGKAKTIEFLLAFVTKRSAIKRIATQVAKKSQGDDVIWFVYPKKTSKNYTCDFHRDSGWEPVNEAGFEGVRMVAIDEDWSALRFRRGEFVKSTSERTSRSPAKRKAKAAKKPTGLTKLRKICLDLPDTRETETWGAPHFRVGEKIFAGIGDEDGASVMSCKLEKPHAKEMLDVEGFSKAPYTGHAGWVSIDLSVVKDWKLIEGLVHESYRLIAPKRTLKKWEP